MRAKGLLKCCHCGSWCKPDPRNKTRQRFCSKPECRAASKRASQKRWLQKNPGYFRGAEHVRRVQCWRMKHPGYWKREEGAAHYAQKDALQDALFSQGVDKQQVKVLKDYLRHQIYQPLQESLIAQQSALTGFISMVSGEALQENIAQILTACYNRGQHMHGVIPWMKKQEMDYESTNPDSTPAMSPGSPAV